MITMRTSLFLILCSIVLQLHAQETKPKSISKHSHNDYEQPHPFQTAYQHFFVSIEADIYLSKGRLLIAHDTAGLKANHTLEEFYLHPISKVIKSNKGSIYPNPNKPLQLLVDIKSEAYTTLASFIQTLKQYPEIIQCHKISIVISGNRPKEEDYDKYPSFIYFDGRPDKNYDENTLKKIALICDDFHRYSKWNGQSVLSTEEKVRLYQVIKKVHQLQKPVRFWGGLDTPTA
jgi:alkaline phosphatase